MLLSYIHALTLITAHRILPGPSSSLSQHTPPPGPYSSDSRPARGADAGDLVDASIDFRVVLEKIRPMESQMRYQIDKLVKLALQPEEVAQKDVVKGS
jgi:U3 small nucleolar ribonucleoprotein protein LCP5